MTGIDSVIGGRMSEHAGRAIDEIYKLLGIDNLGSKALPALLKNLKDELQNGINESLVSEGKERIVVFIDDLDRIAPERALQLLESIKNYLDCLHCVFIIAVDYTAVSEGAQSRYGISEAKSKHFFEKIIQVNYQLPVSRYNLDNYISKRVDSLLEELKIELNDYTNEYYSLVKYATHGNPRAIKRLLNSTSLYFLTNERESNNPYTNIIICALVCMQVFYDSLFQDIMHNLQYSRFNVVRQIFGSYDRLYKESGEEERKKVASTLSISQNEVDSFLNFCHIFISILKNRDFIYDEKLIFIRQLMSKTSSVDVNTHVEINKVLAFDIMEEISFCEAQGIDINKVSILDIWDKNNKKIGLPVSVGIDSTGNEVILDITDTKTGYNGLISGVIGSGKSELLTTYVLGAAINYSVDRVEFCLVDFKGGGFINLFWGLPHVKTSIFNAKELEDYIKWLDSENIRRQFLLNDAGVRSIKEYALLWNKDLVKRPISEIIIIIDEFAIIKRENPELLKKILNIVQYGHIVGIHLLLATQVPSGIVDEFTFSICDFKVSFKHSRLDSMDVLHSEMADDLTRPGQAILLTQGQYRLFQVFYSQKLSEDGTGKMETELDILVKKIRTTLDNK